MKQNFKRKLMAGLLSVCMMFQTVGIVPVYAVENTADNIVTLANEVYAVYDGSKFCAATAGAPSTATTTVITEDNKTTINHLYVMGASVPTNLIGDSNPVNKNTNLKTVTCANTVITIGKQAFKNCTALTSVTMPNVTTIGQEAFKGCANLTSVTMPNATTIEKSAFEDCAAIASVAMPKATTIGENAFNGCAKLASLTLGETPPTTVGTEAFSYCPNSRTLIIQGNTANQTEVLAAYKAAADGDGNADGKWYGWTLPAAMVTVTEQFSLATGQTYYFDLSAEKNNIGTINTAVPDTTLHYVPFTYAGTVNAYNLISAMATTDEYANANKSDRSLFVADYNVSYLKSWNNLNTANLIFGKTFDTNYKLRSLSTGSSRVNDIGSPTTNEWDSIWGKSGLTDPIKNWNSIFSWGQDTDSSDASSRALRGKSSATCWTDRDSSYSDKNFGWRPAFEVLNPATLTTDGLKAVALNLNGGSFNSKTDALNIVCAGTTFKAPSGDGLTPSSAKIFDKWNTVADGKGTSYDVGASVPSSVTTLYAQWALPKAATPTTATFAATGADSGSLSGLTADESYKYSVNGGSNYTDFTGTTATISSGITITNGVWVVKKGDGTTTGDSEPQKITVTKATAPTVGKTDETSAENSGTITGVTTVMEYKLSTASSYIAISDTTVTGLPAGTYNVRVKATGTVLASADTSVTIAAFVPTPIATDLSYSLTAVDYTGSAISVSVTAKDSKNLGAITVKYAGNTTAPTNAGTYAITVDTAGSAEYTAVTALSLGNFIINKVAYTGNKAIAASVFESGQAGATVTLPTLPTGANYGTPQAGGTITMTDMSISHTTLTYTAPSATASQTGTMTIPVTGATNYDNYNVVVTVIYTAKTPQAISYANANISKTYGDAKFTNPLTQTTVNGAITYASDDVTVATVNSTTGEVTIVAVGDGSATITATAAATATHAEAKASYIVTVLDAPITTHTITASAGTGGNVSPSGSVTVNDGESKTFAITPNSGYRISSVTVDGASQVAISTYTFSNVTGNHTISASFAYNTPVLPPISGGSGSTGGGDSSGTTTPPTEPVVTAPPAGSTNTATEVKYDDVKTATPEVSGETTVATAEIALDETVADAATATAPIEIKVALSTTDVASTISDATTKSVDFAFTVSDSIATNPNVYIKDIKVSSDILQAAATAGKDLTFSINSANGKPLFSMSFKGSELSGKNLSDVNLAMNMVKPSAEVAKSLPQSTVLSFENNGAFPAPCTVTANVADTYKDGTVLNLYYDNVKKGTLELVKEGLTVAFGEVVATIGHASDYILSTALINTTKPSTNPATGVALLGQLF